MNVQRYEIEEYQEEYSPAEMVEASDGDYVLHSDYAALEARCAGLEEALLEIASHGRDKFDRDIASTALTDITPDEVQP